MLILGRYTALKAGLYFYCIYFWTKTKQGKIIMKKFLYFKEPVDENPFLEKFYKSPREYSFHIETFMLTRWQSMLRKAYLRAFNRDMILLSDWGIVEAFINMLFHDDQTLSLEEYRLLKELSEILYDIYPDVIYFLDIDIDKAKENIKRRGRSCEKAIASENSGYLELLRSHKMEAITKMREFADIKLIFIHNKNLKDADKIILRNHSDKLRYIWVTGIIGAGKSYVCKKLIKATKGDIYA